MPRINSPQIDEYLERFLNHPTAPKADKDAILIDTFGDTPKLIDRLLALVLAGTKTATCSSLWAWEHENESPITPGTLALILDSAHTPHCVIETTAVEIMPYNQVPASFARAEGEHSPLDLPDDQVLAHWRQGHWSFYNRTLPPLGLTPTQDMPVICEHFKVIYTEL